MTFTYKCWERFCAEARKAGLQSIPAKEVPHSAKSFFVLKHDVETDVAKARQMALIEHKYGHRGSYYVQAYLMHDGKNVQMLKEMQSLGHEISYHYDVMDSSKGDMAKATSEFAENLKLFEDNGFKITTVCQHGNPVVERVGYTSNRDFFRCEKTREAYPHISDIMVNYKDSLNIEYFYFSDAGRKFKRIWDPINNDITNSDDKNISYDNLGEVLNALPDTCGNIISTHPHRYTKSAVIYTIKALIFKTVKAVARILIKIPFMKKFMSKYYYLAKKL